MARTGWERFPLHEDQETDGYFHEPLTLRTDQDSGAAVNIAIRREKEAVVAFLRRRAAGLTGAGSSAAANTLRVIAQDIEDGKHHAQATQPSHDAAYGRYIP